MQLERGAKYQDIVAGVATVALHALALIFLLLNLNLTAGTPQLTPEEVQPIPAEVIDELAVREELARQAEEERKRLANFPVGQGLFFAGQNHVHIQIIASQTEQSLITTNPIQTTKRQNDTLSTNGYVDPNEKF